MAEYRPIKIRMWHDTWFLELTPEEKLIWVFLLTNEFMHISGIYEMPKPLISPLTGVTEALKILDKFEKDGKILHKNGWIFLKNYLKNNNKQISKKNNITRSIMSYLSENSFLVELFNLTDEAPYKELLSPCPKNKKGKIKKEKRKKKEKESRFAPPSPEEVNNYCRERNNNINPEQFIAFYESNGWKVGSNKMKNWRAAIRTWEQRNKSNKKLTTLKL